MKFDLSQDTLVSPTPSEVFLKMDLTVTNSRLVRCRNGIKGIKGIWGQACNIAIRGRAGSPFASFSYDQTVLRMTILRVRMTKLLAGLVGKLIP